MSSRPPKGGSGEHPAVVAFRKKLDSFAEHAVAEFDQVTKRLERLRQKDPRRDGDSEPPVDEVDPDAIPLIPPTKKTPR